MIRLGIIMNGVTGRMGTNQHLVRSILAIREQGGVPVGPTETIMPDPILVGRNALKLERLAEAHGVERWTTDLEEALSHPDDTIYFDAQTTGLRFPSVKRAIEAGKHIYCEKPSADNLDDAVELARRCRDAGVKNGVVQDKLWLPGLLKLSRLIEKDFFGRIFCVKGDFGYWVYEGDTVPAQRPSWNYKRDAGGGIIMDMLSHWRYVLDNLFGEVEAVTCIGAHHIPKRWDEQGQPYDSTAEDAAYATFRLKGNVIAQFNSSWQTRVRRDDLLTIQVDGTHGSAVAGLRECWIQPYGATPTPVWNPDIPQPVQFFDSWQQMPEQEPFDNAFKAQWERFLRHVALDEPFPWSLLEGAKGVQLAELAKQSWEKRAWMEVPEINA